MSDTHKVLAVIQALIVAFNVVLFVKSLRHGWYGQAAFAALFGACAAGLLWWTVRT